MAYDVIKTINGRDYRYRVQSERDQASGKLRNRWTYVGRVSGEGEGEARSGRHAPKRTRVDLLEAAERLLARGDARAVTVSAIAAEAGLAHGTFYRHFADRNAALEALARHIRETRGVPEENLRDDVGSVAEARAGLRAWVEEKLRAVVARRGEMRAWYALMESDERLAAFRAERRDATLARMRAHFAVLAARGLARVRDPDAAADVLAVMLNGLQRAAVVDGEPLDEARITGAADVAERAIFAA